MPRYFIQLSFKGTHFHGWQSQNNAITVQSELEKALQTILNESIKTTGAGRTDTGVHARFYIAHFDTNHPLALDKAQFLYKMNAVIHPDIALYDIFPVNTESHARYSALSRTYTYYISKVKDPFNAEFSWYYSVPLNLEIMNEAAAVIKKHSDFTSFSKLHSNVNNNICTVKEAFWTDRGNTIDFSISANRFLRNMVRSLVGTMVEIGRGKIDVAALNSIFEGRDRRLAGYSAPACGLFLTHICYTYIS